MLIDPIKTYIYAKAVKSSTAAPGCSFIVLPDGTTFTCEPDGTPSSRPGENVDEPYQWCQVIGGLAHFRPLGVGTPAFTFAVAVLDKLP